MLSLCLNTSSDRYFPSSSHHISVISVPSPCLMSKKTSCPHCRSHRGWSTAEFSYQMSQTPSTRQLLQNANQAQCHQWKKKNPKGSDCPLIATPSEQKRVVTSLLLHHHQAKCSGKGLISLPIHQCCHHADDIQLGWRQLWCSSENYSRKWARKALKQGSRHLASLPPHTAFSSLGCFGQQTQKCSSALIHQYWQGWGELYMAILHRLHGYKGNTFSPRVLTVPCSPL